MTPRYQLILITALVAVACGDRAAEPIELDITSQRSAFTGGTSRPSWPSFRLLSDSANNAIVEACVGSASLAELKSLGFADLEQRLDTLLKGNVIARQGDRYDLTFPVLIGEGRRILDSVATHAAAELVPVVDSIIAQIRGAITDREDVLFHVLWSRVIDGVWDGAWRLRYPDAPGPTDVVWVVHPQHRYAVGTNYVGMPGQGSLALTWGPRYAAHLSPLTDATLEFHQAGWGRPVTDTARLAVLERFGLVAGSEYRGFVYHSGDELDLLLDTMIDRYARAVAVSFDYESVADILGTTTSDAFVVLLHEIAYALFEELDHSGRLLTPRHLIEGGSDEDAYRLVSIVLNEPPAVSDEAMAMFQRNGWHGSAEVVAKFREVLEEDPRNSSITLYLGLSLYDMMRYDEAVETFRQLITLSQGDTSLTRIRDWSHIWIGHIYDVSGERESAIREYEIAVATADPVGRQMFGQYGIGPVNAVEWARERIRTPWTRR